MPGEGEQGAGQGAGGSGQGQSGAGAGQQGAGAGGGQQQGGSGQGHEQFVPYERFNEVNEKAKAMERRLAAIEAAGQQQAGQGQGRQQEGAGQGQGENEDDLFYKDPRGYTDRRLEQMRYEDRRESALGQLRDLSEYTEDLEKKMVQFIRENELGTHRDPRKAIALAYQGVTGKKWEDASKGYGDTRRVKERLARASGSGSGGGGKTLEQLRGEKVPHGDEDARKKFHADYLAASQRESE